jgi:hypothetical protein
VQLGSASLIHVGGHLIDQAMVAVFVVESVAAAGCSIRGHGGQVDELLDEHLAQGGRASEDAEVGTDRASASARHRKRAASFRLTRGRSKAILGAAMR